MKPVYAITNPRFVYRNAVRTSVADTWREHTERIERAWAEAHQEKAEREATPANVQTLRRTK